MITSRISSDVADIRLFSFTDAKGFISTSLFASILKHVLNVSILSLMNLLNRLANSKLVSWIGRVAACCMIRFYRTMNYMERLLNVENEWEGEVGCPEVMGPWCLTSEEEVATDVVSDMMKAFGGFGT